MKPASPPRMRSNIKIGVDIGGTFTDLVLFEEGRKGSRPQPPLIHKALSTPENPARGVLRGIAEILELAGCDPNLEVDLIHGTTVATNACLEGKGALVALITTQGFEDVIEIGRQNRPTLYDLNFEKPNHIVQPELRFGVSERTLHSGEVLRPVYKEDKSDSAEAKSWLAQLENIRRKVKASGVESIAICFLFSYANPNNEILVYQSLQDMDLPISVSHLIVPEYREYERFSTTVVNAYITPLIRRYVNSLEKQTRGSLRIMQSNGGSISAKTASEQPVRTILSGPAGGVVGALETAKKSGYNRIISFDMGGTSTDVCLCDGEVKVTTEGSVGPYPLKVPIIDIHTVGAGGGSIAYLDEGGALRVGPQSAGSNPGPICYGRHKTKHGVQSQLTLTDANVFLGWIPPDHFLGGKMKLDLKAVESEMIAFAAQLKYSPQRAAEGIIKVVNATMERAIRVISIERGHDPRDFILVSFGGSGGLHACELARSLSIPLVLIPKNPGTLSAFGMVISDVVKSYSQTVLGRGNPLRLPNPLRSHDPSWLSWFETMEKQAAEEMKRENFEEDEIVFQRSLDLRYEGQSYEINVPFSDRFLDSFAQAYVQRYGYSGMKNGVEVVNLRLNAVVSPQKPAFYQEKLQNSDPSKALICKRDVWVSGNVVKAPVYNRELLKHGNVIKGLAIIVEYSATTMIPDEFVCNIDKYGNLLISGNCHEIAKKL